MARPLRIGNCSGFYGDRLSAMREMLEGGQLDVLTGDYLAELTMLILYRSRLKDPTRGYATTFLRQLEDCLGLAVDRGVRIVVNAGGLEPARCAAAVAALADRLGVPVPVAHVEGDDLMPRLDELQRRYGLDHLDTGRPLTVRPLTANAYLGGFGITECLAAGAGVVVTGRVTDASLVVGPAAWHHGWERTDHDALAGAVVAGHLLECGAQVTGGNYAFFTEVPGLEHVAFPLAEVAADGSCVVTKHAGGGGLVSVGTVTAQLLYEIEGPAYLGPDVVTHLDTVVLEPAGPDRVLVRGATGSPPPATTKVCLNVVGGLRNTVTFLLTGLDVTAKADVVRRQLAPLLARAVSHDVRLEPTASADPGDPAAAVSRLTVTVKGDDPAVVGRAFSAACVELALASYPGATVSAPPGDASPYGVYWPAVVPAHEVGHTAVLPDCRRVDVPPAPVVADGPPPGVPAAAPTDPGPPGGPTRRLPLGTVAGARSGDKGGTANIGVWVRSDAAYPWLVALLDEAGVRRLLPETANLPVVVHRLPRLRAVNVVVPGLLGEGVSSSTRLDPQAKGLGEQLRARHVDIPVALLADVPGAGSGGAGDEDVADLGKGAPGRQVG